MRFLTPPNSRVVPNGLELPRLLYLSWLEARPVVQLIFQLRFAAGVVLGWESTFKDIDIQPIVTAALGWLSATWGIYLLNGVADIVEDRENASGRPIARGCLPARPATALCWVLSAFALTCGLLVSTQVAVVVALMLAVGWAYSLGPRAVSHPNSISSNRSLSTPLETRPVLRAQRRT
ncbi:UbiA family prenyltransferase [Amycolatopsis lurida]